MRRFGEYVKMAMKNIWANKIRTLLTMLGIIIGISSVILIISIGNGATEMISSELGNLGKGQINFYTMSAEEKYNITEEQLEHVRDMEGVKAVATQSFFEGTTSTARNDFEVDLVAFNADGFTFMEYEFVHGREYTDQEAKDGKAYCVISEDDAIKMYGSTNVVGLDFTICIQGKYDVPVTILGVTKSEDNGTLVAALSATPSVQVIIPPQAITRTLGIDLQKGITDFFVLKEDEADAKKMCEEIVDYLGASHYCKGEDVYLYQSFDDTMKIVNDVINVITMFVAFVASVSLLVGGIGVMNIMLVSVTERTREIGIRKALGAKTGSITVQFLAESAFITLIGGIIGILFGIGGAWGIAKIIGAMVPAMQFSPILNFDTVLIASLFSSGVGLFFGIYPARKAAKLSPIEALRQN